jgi:drug/metabolite transporter (DMT)-like permease
MIISDNARGLLLVSFGVFILSPDSLLIRLIDIDLWSLMFLRGLFMGICLFVLNLLVNASAPLQQFKDLDQYGWSIIVLMTVSSFFFVAAVQNTSVAHTLIIVGAVPVVAAILGIIFLREYVSRNSWITIFIVMIGLIFVVYDDQQSSIEGDLYALAACLLWSGNFVLARLTTMKNMIAAMSVSGFLMALSAYPLATLSLISVEQLALSVLLGLLVGVAFSMITLAPRFIPSAEVAVFMPLESVFGSLLVWWFLDEYPGWISLTAGSVIILTIMTNSYFQISKASNRI